MTKTVAYLGIPGSYSYSAAVAYFSDQADQDNLIASDTFAKIFELVNSGRAQYGVLPISNTINGVLTKNQQLFDIYQEQIVGEYELKVEHCLLVCPESKVEPSLKNIKKVYSHPYALEQCSKFFAEHPWIEAIEAGDTAHAARFVSQQQDLSLAAIGGAQAAKLYDLKIAAKNLEDSPKNFTKFIIFTNPETPDKV